MVKYFALSAIVLGSALISDVAQARGRHGCASCGTAAAGCPGGVCAMPAAPSKMATTSDATAPIAAAPAGQSAVANTAPAAPRYYASNMSRGLFGRRR